MTKRKFTLKVFAITMLLALLTTSGAYGVDLWSEDLWPTPTNPPANTGTQGNSSSGGGLWSEDLWKVTPTQPTVPTAPTLPKPTPPSPSISKPANPLPAKPFEDSDMIVMQVENNKALVNGAEKDLPVPPTIINGRLMLPLRFIGDAINAKFTSVNVEKKTVLEFDGKKIEIWGGKSTAKVNGKEIQLDTSPVVLDGSTLVPVKLVSEHFGYPMEFEPLTKTVILKRAEKIGVKPDPKPEPKPELKPEPKNPVLDSKFNYFGVWELRMDGFAGGLLLGTLIVQEDGTYGMRHSISGTSVGTWRQGEKDEVIGLKDVLILEDGPGGIDWVMVPKKDGLVGVRYHYGYDISNKIWFEDSLGIKLEK